MKYTNREAAERIVSAICNALPYLPDKKDLKKLIDFTEKQINRQTAQQSVQADGANAPHNKVMCHCVDCKKWRVLQGSPRQ